MLWAVLRRAVPIVSLSGAVVLVGSPAMAAEQPAPAGCVSNADFAKLNTGQSLRYVHRVAGADAQLSVRRWSRNGTRYQERQYVMCVDDA